MVLSPYIFDCLGFSLMPYRVVITGMITGTVSACLEDKKEEGTFPGNVKMGKLHKIFTTLW
jgi:hypothetical protein